MAIQEYAEFWTGTEAADIDEYLELLTEDGYPADRFDHSRCTCGSTVFKLLFDDEQGCAARVCTSCSDQSFIGDSEEYWDEAEPVACVCPCGSEGVEIAVGFSHRQSGDIKWITIGHRCAKCGMLGSCADWKIDYSPTDHLYTRV